jgi:hypothetical protein
MARAGTDAPSRTLLIAVGFNLALLGMMVLQPHRRSRRRACSV